MNSYDYIIIGAGASGLLLADAIGKDAFFKNKTVLLLDKNAKQTNDRTWCFWEKNTTNFDPVVSKKWNQIHFAGKKISKDYSIVPYSYKMIKGLDFYNHYLTKLATYHNVTFINEQVENIENSTTETIIRTTTNSYKATKVFNSIYDTKEPLQQKKYPVLQQHFIGWFVKTEQSVFSDQKATFMDFSVPQKGNTRFMYVLPFSKTEALVEYTLFSENLLKQEEYEQAIKKYITEKLGVKNYQITETERGSIPMTSFDFAKKNTPNMLYIGTAGGWTKASTGYTFKKTSTKVAQLITHLKQNKALNTFSKKDKFWFYDLLLLDILYEKNELGQTIFEALFKNRKPQLIFKFLDEETNLWEDIRFISSLSPFPFIRALFKRIF